LVLATQGILGFREIQGYPLDQETNWDRDFLPILVYQLFPGFLLHPLTPDCR